MSDTDYTTLQQFSEQPTTITETTMAETVGLSMHNLVANQQQSQMTTAASVTNACARLLAIPQAAPVKPELQDEAPKKKSIFSRS
ncbi:RebB family R body protein [Photobacterium leiognathi]|uniref:RebB family R body protein n=1 Tax=Photobacterium leiognathi TaxID=553611 RepID=UPI0029828F2A|nr:RebB family R body protein [Photobacterium leiognathi]